MATRKRRAAARSKRSVDAAEPRSADRREPPTDTGPFATLGGAAERALDVPGLRAAAELAVTGAAAGAVAASYGRDAVRAQLRAVQSTWSLLEAARARVVGSGLARSEIFAVLDLLAERVAAALADLMRVAGLTTTEDFDHICERLDRIAERVAALERRRLVGREASASDEVPRLSLRPSQPQSAASPGDAGSESREGAEGTMVIGSVPEGDVVEPARERASSMSSEPDALSYHLSKRSGSAGGSTEEARPSGSTPRRQPPR